MDTPAKHQTQNRRAVIDIGSNSVKLLVADIANGVVCPIVHEGKQTRLGQRVFNSGKLQPEAITATIRAAAEFAKLAKDNGAVEIRTLATSAAREATNGHELAAGLAGEGLVLEIIDGQTEAKLVLRGARSLPDFAEGPLAILDVGGGSTELLIADESTLRFQQSFPLGTVRWLESFPLKNANHILQQAKVDKALNEFIDELIMPQLDGLPLPATVIGAGGTPVFLARILSKCDELNADEIEAAQIKLPELQELKIRLWNMPLSERQSLPGLPANRADVILFGAAIYEAVMVKCGFTELQPTMRGVRYGALLEWQL